MAKPRQVPPFKHFSDEQAVNWADRAVCCKLAEECAAELTIVVEVVAIIPEGGVATVEETFVCPSLSSGVATGTQWPIGPSLYSN